MGDRPIFADLAAAVARSPELARQALQRAAPEIAVVAAGDARRLVYAQQSPDGTPYPPLKFPRLSGGDKRLLDKGLLVASVSAAVEGDELVMRANAPGARVHHYGATIFPVNAKRLVFTVGAGPIRRGKPTGLLTIFARKVVVPGVNYLGLSAATLGRIGAAQAKHLAALVRDAIRGT